MQTLSIDAFFSYVGNEGINLVKFWGKVVKFCDLLQNFMTCFSQFFTLNIFSFSFNLFVVAVVTAEICIFKLVGFYKVPAYSRFL